MYKSYNTTIRYALVIIAMLNINKTCAMAPAINTQNTIATQTYTLSENVTLLNPIKITRSVIIDGQNTYNITCDNGAYILIDNPDATKPITVTFKNIQLLGLKNYVSGERIYKKTIDCGPNKKQHLIFENTELYLDGDFSLADFCITVQKNTSFCGPYTLLCQEKIMLGAKSRYSVKPGTNIKYLKH